MSSFIEVQGVATDRSDTFPYSGMRVLGSIQITLGILTFVLGVLDLIMTLTSYESDLDKYGSRYDVVVTLTVASCPLWCGMWFAVTGALGTCITRDRAHSLQFFKVGFLILNILCCALFGPICAALSGFISYTRHNLDSIDYQWLVTLTICFLAVLEAAIATVSAAVTCCCSTLRSAQIHIIVNPSSLIGQGNDTTTERKSSNASARSRANSNNNTSNSVLNNSSSRTNLSLPRSNRNSTVSNPREPQSSRKQRNEVSDYSLRQLPRIEIQEPINDGFGFSSGYEKLKKWTIHHS